MLRSAGIILISLSIITSGAAAKKNSNSNNKNSSNYIKKIVKEGNKFYILIGDKKHPQKIPIGKKELEEIAKKVLKKDGKKSVITKNKKTKTKKVVKKEKSKNKKIASKGKKSSKTTLKKGEYIVQSGDTLFSIALKYNVSLSDLVKANKLTANSVIHPGDKLKIPSKSITQEAKSAIASKKSKKNLIKKEIYHTVKKGDTLKKIAKKYNVSVRDIIKLNNLKKNPRMYKLIGEKLLIKKVSIKKATKSPQIKIVKKKSPQVKRNAKYYRVKRGDTIWKIARMHNLTVEELKLLNRSKLRRGLRKGSLLRVSKIEAIKLKKAIAKRRRAQRKRVYFSFSERGFSGGGNNRIVRVAKRYLGTRYVWGGNRPGGFDCSGFAQYVFKKATGVVLPRISRRQAYYGRYVTRSQLRAGDLVFFDTSRRRRGYVNHVGIYIGNTKFIHASSAKHRVIITSLNRPFYRARFMWGRRVN